MATTQTTFICPDCQTERNGDPAYRCDTCTEMMAEAHAQYRFEESDLTFEEWYTGVSEWTQDIINSYPQPKMADGTRILTVQHGPETLVHAQVGTQKIKIRLRGDSNVFLGSQSSIWARI